MLISHKHKFIYTKTLKTAGTSVESYFEKFCMPENEWQISQGRDEYECEEGIIGFRGDEKDRIGKKWYNHMPASEIKDKIGPDIWEEYFKFCVIRNPFDKMLSSFYYNRKINSEKHNKSELFKTVSEEINNFRRWLNKGIRIKDNDKYFIDGEVCIDYFIRYEELETGIGDVCKKLNLPFEPERLPKFKSGFRNHNIPLKDFYDAKSIYMVNKNYEKEIEMFGYEIDMKNIDRFKLKVKDLMSRAGI